MRKHTRSAGKSLIYTTQEVRLLPAKPTKPILARRTRFALGWTPRGRSCERRPTCRASSLALPSILCLAFLDGLPLHVRDRVGSALAQGHDVIAQPARTGARRAAGRRARMKPLELRGHVAVAGDRRQGKQHQGEDDELFYGITLP